MCRLNQRIIGSKKRKIGLKMSNLTSYPHRRFVRKNTIVGFLVANTDVGPACESLFCEKINLKSYLPDILSTSVSTVISTMPNITIVPTT